jgi:hypothetical protein
LEQCSDQLLFLDGREAAKRKEVSLVLVFLLFPNLRKTIRDRKRQTTEQRPNYSSFPFSWIDRRAFTKLDSDGVVFCFVLETEPLVFFYFSRVKNDPLFPEPWSSHFYFMYTLFFLPWVST